MQEKIKAKDKEGAKPFFREFQKYKKQKEDMEKEFPDIAKGDPNAEPEVEEEMTGDQPSDFDDVYHDADELEKCLSVLMEEEKYCKHIMKTNKADADYFEAKLDNIEYKRGDLEMRLKNQLISQDKYMNGLMSYIQRTS